MGFVRSGLSIFLASLLFLVLFFTGISLTLSWSLEYENAQPAIFDFSMDMVDNFGFVDALEKIYPAMELYCQNNTEFNFSNDMMSLAIPCDVIHKGTNEILNYTVSGYVEDIYYKDYNCSLFSCLQETKEPYVLVSKTAADYWNNKFKWSIALLIGLFALMFLFFESKHSVLIVTGILSIVCSLFFRKLDWALGFLPDGTIVDFLISLVSKSYNVFLYMLIIGICFLLVGLAFEFLGWGIKISGWLGAFREKRKEKKGQLALGDSEGNSFSEEDVKEIVREELKKSKRK